VTSEELRRRARQSRALAARRLRGSDEVTVVIRACSGSFDAIESQSREAWSGRAASEFLDTVASRRRALESGLDDVRRIAAQFVDESSVLLDEARRLERQADEIDAVTTASRS
jgi:ubiquinone biosynthesis protein UbiJ